MRRIIFLFIPICVLFSIFSTKQSISYNSGTGALNLDTFTNFTRNCWSCHKPFVINDSVNININGLPINSNIQPGHTYTFSVNLTNVNPSTTRSEWGFAMRAINAAGTAVGTFTPNAQTQVGTLGSLKHVASTYPTASSYTYSGLQWTAPMTPTGSVITFEASGLSSNNNGIATGDFVAVFVGSAVLPIELKDFTATENNNKIDLDWNTGSELNFSHFEIERSVDGIKFEKVASVNGKGNQSTGAEYTYTDAPSVAGKYLYRLKMVDKDNSYKYSKVVSAIITTGVDFEVNAYPNPNNGRNISLLVNTEKAYDVKVIITDLKGAVVYTNTFGTNVGTNTISISNNFSAGTYFVKVFSNNQFKKGLNYIIQ